MTSVLYVFALTATLAVFAGAGKPEYCNIPSCKGKPHTRCVYDFPKVSSRCKEVHAAALTPEEKNTIVQVHNRLRTYVARGAETRGINGPQPAARNLGSLKWDQELADIAQTWANQCNYGHDQCRDSKRFEVGQNIYEGMGNYSQFTIQYMMKSWYNEVKLFDKNKIKSFILSDREFGKVGRYTQIVWAKTTLVGCGLIRYNNLSYLVCNYGPSGNVKTQEVYTTRQYMP